jgi:hypothetical protein
MRWGEAITQVSIRVKHKRVAFQLTLGFLYFQSTLLNHRVIVSLLDADQKEHAIMNKASFVRSVLSAWNFLLYRFVLYFVAMKLEDLQTNYTRLIKKQVAVLFEPNSVELAVFLSGFLPYLVVFVTEVDPPVSGNVQTASCKLISTHGSFPGICAPRDRATDTLSYFSQNNPNRLIEISLVSAFL